ncbi:MAG: hypothetical protein ACXAEN_25455 [Candidatus Thorarchaeota archaeon]
MSDRLMSALLRQVAYCKAEIRYARTTVGCRRMAWMEAKVIVRALRRSLKLLSPEEKQELKALIKEEL